VIYDDMTGAAELASDLFHELTLCGVTPNLTRTGRLRLTPPLGPVPGRLADGDVENILRDVWKSRRAMECILRAEQYVRAFAARGDGW